MITSICKYISNITCDKEKVNEMKLHMLMLMNAWMMHVLIKCKFQMQCLTLGCYIKHDLVRGRIDMVEWLMPGCEEVPAPPNGYVVSFTPFHEHGLMIPPHPFF